MARAPKINVQGPIISDDDGDLTGLTAQGGEPAALSDEIQAQLKELAELKAKVANQPVLVRNAGDFGQVADVKRIVIILEDNDQIPPTGLFIQPNGRPYLLMPAVEARVPIEVINVLNDAVAEVAIVDPISLKVIGFRKRLRFPYQVVARAAA